MLAILVRATKVALVLLAAAACASPKLPIESDGVIHFVGVAAANQQEVPFVEGWVKSMEVWRLEVTNSTDRTLTIVRNQDAVTFRDGSLPPSITSLSSSSATAVFPFPSNFRLGTIYLQDLDIIIPLLEESAVSVRVSGRDSVLGRAAAIVEIEYPPGKLGIYGLKGPVERLWFDETLPVVMRQEVYNGEGDLLWLTRLTSIEHSPVPASFFQD